MRPCLFQQIKRSCKMSLYGASRGQMQLKHLQTARLGKRGVIGEVFLFGGIPRKGIINQPRGGNGTGLAGAPACAGAGRERDRQR